MEHLQTTPAPIAEARGEPVPQGLEQLILACLAKDRADRPASAEALADANQALDQAPTRVEAWEEDGIREEFGKDLRLIGGIDLDTLRSSKASIKKEIETKVPPLIEQGGFIPLADGRVRADVPFENYCYYRGLLRRIIEKG